MSHDKSTIIKVHIMGTKDVAPLIFGEEDSGFKIYSDDTIDYVKRKVYASLKDTIGASPPVQCMYLMARTRQKLSSVGVFDMLTQNGKLALTYDRLVGYLQNISDASKGLEDTVKKGKSVYTYDDVFAIGLDDKDWVVNIPVGQRFVTAEHVYPFTVDPMAADKYDPILERTAKDITTTTNGSLVMDIGNFNGELFMFDATTVLAAADRKGLSAESTIRIYFPLLASDGINATSELDAALHELEEHSDNMIGEGFARKVNSVRIMHDIQESQPSDYIEAEGVDRLVCVVSPAIPFNLPLDVVFKKLKTSQEVPLVKYNPGKRQEKVYRLYTAAVATNGKKIPYLPKATIFRLAKTIGKSKGVIAYNETDGHTVTCEFDANAGITISAEFGQPLSLDECDNVITRQTAAPLSMIASYLSQSGYVLPLFTSIMADDTELVDARYVARYRIQKNIDLAKITGCITPIFNVVESSLSKGIEMRFKRVADYSEVDGVEAFTIEMIKKNVKEHDIVQRLQDAYGMSPERAVGKLAEVVGSIQVVRSANPTRRIRIRNNPGFATRLTKDQFSATVTATVEGLNNVGYISTVPIYLNSVVIAGQGVVANKSITKEMGGLCKKPRASKSKKDEVVLEEVVADAENAYKDNEAGVPAAVSFGDDDDGNDGEDMLDILLGDDDDDDEGEDDAAEAGLEGGHSSPQDVLRGGADEDAISDITGMSLANPNPFFKKMEALDPALFLTKQDGKFHAYSRACPWNVRRQPVILTDAEKADIDKEHPGSYQHAVKYGSSPDKQYWYICPRYWSLKDNTSLTQAEVESGKYGGVIPDDAKKVPKGKPIFQFSDNKYHVKDGKYVQHYPGFVKAGSHPDGLCLPCCFKSWDSPSQEKRRAECSNEDAAEQGKKAPQGPAKLEIESDEYIKGPDKFPLDRNRWGYLPAPIAAFLQMDSRECQVSATNTNLRPNHVCLLRHGVELVPGQSFVACLADLFADRTSDQRIPSVAEMRQVLHDAVDLDTFVRLQNGTLITEFEPALITETADVASYAGTQLYNATDMESAANVKSLRRAILALEAFKSFLLDKSAGITYTYLWDLCTSPNPKLFPNGMNLVVLLIPEDDSTSNVEVVCPTNHYSSSAFDSSKKTFIVVKRGDYMEPVYAVEDVRSNYTLSRLFSLRNKNLLPNLKRMLGIIRDAQNELCRPLPSAPNVYTFETNVNCATVLKALIAAGYTVHTAIINFSGKAIGLSVSGKKGDVRVVVPCAPSEMPTGTTATFIDSDGLWRDFQTTFAFLEEVAKVTKGRVLCRPSLQLVEDGLCIGIITETNQTVLVSPPAPPIDGLLPTVEAGNSILADTALSRDREPDHRREKYMKEMRLDTSFYNAFRNTVRILLNKHEYAGERGEIEALIASRKSYLTKLQTIAGALKKLCSGSVVFADFETGAMSAVREAHACVGKSEAQCTSSPFCVSTGETCQLAIPKRGSISDVDNEVVYFEKMADELIRYTRVRSFIFQPKAYLAFGTVGYNLGKDEVILLQSLLNQEYFEDMVVAKQSQYVTSTAADNAEPLESVPYDNLFTIKGTAAADDVTCNHTKKSQLSRKWKGQFPADSIELVFDTEPPTCTFDTMVTAVRDHARDEAVTPASLKELLANEYAKIAVSNLTELTRLLVAGGKKRFASLLKTSRAEVGDVVMSDQYYLSNIDVVVISQHYKVPLVIFSSTVVAENKQPLLITYSDDSDNHYFLKTPGVQVDAPLKYKLVVGTRGAKIRTSQLSGQLRKYMEAKSGYTSLDKLLSMYTQRPRGKTLRIVGTLDEVAPPPAKKTGRRIVLK